MAAINREFLLQANLFLLIALMRSRSRKIKRKKHRFWVREIFKLRKKLGVIIHWYKRCVFMIESTSIGKFTVMQGPGLG